MSVHFWRRHWYYIQGISIVYALLSLPSYFLHHPPITDDSFPNCVSIPTSLQYSICVFLGLVQVATAVLCSSLWHPWYKTQTNRSVSYYSSQSPSCLSSSVGMILMTYLGLSTQLSFIFSTLYSWEPLH